MPGLTITLPTNQRKGRIKTAIGSWPEAYAYVTIGEAWIQTILRKRATSHFNAKAGLVLDATMKRWTFIKITDYA